MFKNQWLSSPYIDEILLINHKDKKVPIFSVPLFTKSSLIIELKRFEIPLIMEANDSTTIMIDPVSSYTIEGKDTTLDYEDVSKGKIILQVSNRKYVYCRPIGSHRMDFHMRFGKFTKINIVRNLFHGIVYDKSTRFEVILNKGLEEFKIVIQNDGFAFSKNKAIPIYSLPKEYIVSSDKLIEYYKLWGIEKIKVFPLNPM